MITADGQLFTTLEAAMHAGATLRQIDYWDRTDCLTPTRPAQGSGSRRRWSLADVLIVAVFVRLRAANIEIKTLGHVGHQLRADPTLDVIEVHTADDAISITVNVALIRKELEGRLAC